MSPGSAINLNNHLLHKKYVAVIPAADFLKISIQTATFHLKMYEIIERYFLQKTTLFSLKNELYSREIFFAVRKEVFFIHNQIPVMNYPQYRRMRKLVHECCNYAGGKCKMCIRDSCWPIGAWNTAHPMYFTKSAKRMASCMK